MGTIIVADLLEEIGESIPDFEAYKCEILRLVWKHSI